VSIEQPESELEQGGFAAAIWAENAQPLAGPHLQRNILEGESAFPRIGRTTVAIGKGNIAILDCDLCGERMRGGNLGMAVHMGMCMVMMVAAAVVPTHRVFASVAIEKSVAVIVCVKV
jgi:hypothetical protein